MAEGESWRSRLCASIRLLFSRPDAPVGPSTAQVGKQVTFQVVRHTNLHPYRFIWGDGKKSNWGNPKRSHVYTADGVYQVRAQQRCPFKFWTSRKSKPTTITVLAIVGCGPSAS